MKTEKILLAVTIAAAAALTRFRFVDFTGNVASAGERPLGVATTDFVDQHFAAWQPPAGDPPDLALAAAALAELLEGAAAGVAQGDPYSPWRQLAGYRVGRQD